MWWRRGPARRSALWIRIARWSSTPRWITRSPSPRRRRRSEMLPASCWMNRRRPSLLLLLGIRGGCRVKQGKLRWTRRFSRRPRS
ncbi:unnamed protein product [Linum tenue]|uniref:Secreted protein n=1 Tax=Linum tenue TaxID=586396 RepID=A0AAV0NQV9_9ROSI|nr:unnamed protein product [Linum tenue]